MRKSLLLALALLLSTAVFAQSRAYIVNEKFNSAGMPNGWYFTGEGADNFNIKTSNNAGGDPNELHLKSSPFITNGIHLVMASANLIGVESVGLSFKHYLSNYQQSSTIGIATSSDNGTTWNTAWSKTYSNESSSGQYSINETVSTSDMGKNDVLFCLFFEGNTYNINHWYFDDIMIFTQGGDENDADLMLSNIDVNSITQAGDVEISFSVNNVGMEDVTTFDASYEINGNTVTETFTCDLSSSSNDSFSFETAANLMPGTYTVNINVENVNGAADIDNSNNSLSKEIKIFMKTVQRTPMIEHFSSSTCQPCVNVDIAMATLTENNPGKYTYTKYPMNMPYTGDPYFINECLVRADYYGVVGVPCIALDGTLQQSSVSQSALDDRLDVASYVDIAGAFENDGNIINLKADVMSYIDMTDVRVFITINEKTTTENASTNGLTEFHHIIMKMMGGEAGIETNLKAGLSQRFEFSYDMSETFMEEIDDLEVAVWVQSYDTKEIHNSHYLYEYAEHPYPAQNVTIENNVISWDAPENGNPTGYNVYVNNVLVAENITNLSYDAGTSATHFAEVFALYDEMTSIGATSIVPISCDAPTDLNAKIEQDAEGFENKFKVTMSWSKVDYAQQYKLYLDGELLETVSGTSFVKGFDEEGEHYFSVATVCDNGESEQSEAFEFELKDVSLEEIENDFFIYPNPARDVVKVSTVNCQQSTVNSQLSTVNCQLSVIRVYNYLGILIEEISVGTRHATSVEINVSDYNAGIYFINVQTENGNQIKKFIKN